MAVSAIDQRILGRICHETAKENPLLSSNLYQILGLSIQLSRKVYRARKLRRLDLARDTKSVSLYHHIIWLAREGLSITEVFILPYCQHELEAPYRQVMAAKLRATFYQILCLFHNQPPLNQLSPKRTPSSSANKKDQETRTRKAALREAIPSVTSDMSYITNPFVAEYPALSPPPTGPLPPIPTTGSTPQGRRSSLRQAGFGSHSDYSAASSANYIMPPRNFVPSANQFFEETARLARSLLPGSNPLRLSVYLEFCIFKWDCGKDFKAARSLASQAFKKALEDEEFITEADFADAREIMASLQSIADRTEGSSRTSPKSPIVPIPATTSPTRKQTTTPVSRFTTRSPGHRRPDHSSGKIIGEPIKKSKASHVVQQTSTSTRNETDKEKKRRILEMAEEEVRRRDSVKSGGSAASRQLTPPSLIRGRYENGNKRSKDR